ncbi:uncharacterized protein LOC132723192 [Ruditapes philippinarum]|uniref:uncharacterized protein LOC132723192 n=1 Tax=Ruditapes philippinarum TaxID=129788 RepID=UPI00295C1FBD|nr:uncharacterized protein LOC132723192 [Ruditapes philippinarum]
MAGIGEVCSHVASILFAIEGTVHVRDSRTVTQEPAYWLLPTSVKKVNYSETRHINFTSAKTLKKTFEKMCDNTVTAPPSTKKSKKPVPEPTQSEISNLFSSLHATGKKYSILSVVPEFADNYRPKVEQLKYAKDLTELKEKNAMQMNYMELLSKCNDISISVTEEEVGNDEIATRQQSQSKLWYKFRSGRITASKMKSVCSTDSSNPSQSLIMSICYPSSHQFSSEATAWGLKNEKLAIDKFVQAFIAEGHENVTVENCGLFISSDSPWLAATPD